MANETVNSKQNSKQIKIETICLLNIQIDCTQKRFYISDQWKQPDYKIDCKIDCWTDFKS